MNVFSDLTLLSPGAPHLYPGLRHGYHYMVHEHFKELILQGTRPFMSGLPNDLCCGGDSSCEPCDSQSDDVSIGPQHLHMLHNHPFQIAHSFFQNVNYEFLAF